MNKIRFIRIILALVCLVLLTTPSVVFADNPSDKNISDSARIDLIQALFGKSITIGEFLQQVLPEEYEKFVTTIPQKDQRILEEKFPWPTLPTNPKVNPELNIPDAEIHVEEEVGIRDIVITHLQIVEDDPIPLGSGYMWHNGRAWTENFPISMTYLSAMSFMFYSPNGYDYYMAGFEYDSGYGVQSVIAAGFETDSSAGWYFTNGVFQYICPPNCSLADGTTQGVKHIYNNPVYCDPYNP